MISTGAELLTESGTIVEADDLATRRRPRLTDHQFDRRYHSDSSRARP
jgi:hypothetical protein